MSNGLAEDRWDSSWGTHYGFPSDGYDTRCFFKEMHESNAFGDVILDVGGEKFSGMLGGLYNGDHKVINVDIGAPGDSVKDWEAIIKMDIEELWEPTANVREKLAKIAAFLGIEPCRECPAEVVDTSIFDQILNYVDFRKTLASCDRYIKPGGRMIVRNCPDWGNDNLFAEEGKRPKDNDEVRDFLTGLGYSVEFELIEKAYKGYNRDTMVLVARKR